MDNPTSPTAPSADQNERATIGDNKPPVFSQEKLDEIKGRADAFMQVSNTWLEVDIETDHLAEQLNDQIAGLRKLHKEVDTLRKGEKKPYDDAAAAIQAAFNPLLKRLEAAGKALKPKVEKYLSEKQRKLDEQKRLEREEAERKAREAEEAAAKAAQSNDIDAQVEAEEAQKAAAAAQKAANKDARANIGSASGGGRTMSLRNRKVAQIKNPASLFLHYQNRPEVMDVLQRLANAEANAAGFEGKIPGCEIVTQKGAA